MNKELPNRKPMRLKDFDYNSVGAYFITICTQNRQCMLSRIVGTGVLDCPKIELTKYGKIADKYIRQLNDFYEHISVDYYVVMPDHIHLLLSVECHGQSRTPVPTSCEGTVHSADRKLSERSKKANSAISKFISTFKRFCNKEYGTNIWQKRSFDHIILSREDYESYARYIYENPSKWYYKILNSENDL